VDQEVVSSEFAGSESVSKIFPLVKTSAFWCVFGVRDTPNSNGVSIRVGLYDAKPPEEPPSAKLVLSVVRLVIGLLDSHAITESFISLLISPFGSAIDDERFVIGMSNSSDASDGYS